MNTGRKNLVFGGLFIKSIDRLLEKNFSKSLPIFMGYARKAASWPWMILVRATAH